MQDALPDSVPTAEENSGKRSDSSGKEPGSTSDRGVEQQLSALLSLHRNLFVSQLCFFKIYNNLPNMNILLLQHSNDGSELYGGFYETTKAPEHPKAKTSPQTGLVPRSQVAKVSVCPQALGALREQTRVFGLENKHSVLKDESSQLETSEVHQVSLRLFFGRVLNSNKENCLHCLSCSHTQNTTRDRELELHFGEIVEKMEAYLNPLLSQFDFPFTRNINICLPYSSIRSQTITPPISDNEHKHVKEEKCSLVDSGEHLVVLADRKLLELPLEALPLLQKEGLASVSRDFSLQLFFSRLSREQILKVESDSKKETKTKGGKGAQKKGVKETPVNPVLPSYTFTMDTTNLKYIVDPYKEGQGEASSSSMLESNRLSVTYKVERHLLSTNKCLHMLSIFEMEQVLSKCSAFIYMGMDPLLVSIPPAKVAAFNLTECRMALLFDRIQSKVKVLPSNNESQKSAELLTLENPLETALLLSLTGVGCIVLNQWHNTLKQKAQDLTAVLDNMLRVKETSGHAIHALKGREHTNMSHHKADQDLSADSKDNTVQHSSALTPAAYNCILYGLPNYIVP
uniref:Uncharacterized protein n=1 Tax=Poecilia formosa TaxID=48698 RepID=A0A087XK97_POEFO